MLYLGLDPGVRSGLALVEATDKRVDVLATWDVPGGAEGFLDWWEEHSPTWREKPVVVIEAFILREGVHGVDITPRDVIGAAKAECKRMGLEWHMESPAGRLKRMPNWALKEMGVELPGNRNRNAKEAVRHCLSFLKSRGNKAVLEVFLGKE